MSGIPYQAVSFAFGAVDTKGGARHIKTGDLVEMRNVRQLKKNEYRKRRGYARTVPTFSGASWTAPSDSMGLVPAAGGVLLTRDGADRAWAYNPTDTQFYDRGALLRVFPRHTADINAAGLSRPQVVEAGANLWIFAKGSGKYYYTVKDKSTGEVIVAPTAVTAASITAFAVAADATNVWLIWTAGGTSCTSHKYVIATPTTAATTATYASGHTFIDNVDMRYLSSPAKIAVVLTGQTAGSNAFRHSYLNTATGAETAGAVESTAVFTTPGTRCPSILVSDGTTSWYYCAWETHTTSGATMQLRIYTINSTTLAVSTNTLVVGVAVGAAATTMAGACAGYVAGNGDRVVYAHIDDLTAEPAPWNYTVTRYTRGSVTTDTVVARGKWVAGKPAQVGSAWYVPLGYEDGGIALASSVQARGFQRTIALHDSDGNLISQALNEESGGLFHTSPNPTVATLTAPVSYVPATVVISSTMVTPNMSLSGSMQDLGAGSIVWDFAATYGPIVGFQGRALVPGGIPCVFGPQESLREVSPLLYPNYFTTSGAATTYDCAVLYRFTSPDGTFWRSAALRGSLSISNGATITVPSLRHKLPNTTCVIEFYAGSSGVPYLQNVVDNDASANTVTFTFSSTLFTDEALYTVGGALSNTSAPAAKHIGVWQNRAFFAATPEKDVVWVSKETFGGEGILLNEVLRVQFTDGTGEITGVGAARAFLALFRRDAIGLLSGPGPDGRGSGNYVPQAVEGAPGTANTRVLLASDKGLYFQGLDGGIYVLAGATVADVSQGMAAYASANVVAAYLHQQAQHALFFLSDGTILVHDVGFPTAEQPLGVWYLWTSSNLARAYGACLDSSGTPWHMESTGVLRKPQDSLWTDAGSGGTTAVLKKFKTGKLAPTGPQGVCRVGNVKLAGQYVGACNVDITIASGSTTSTHSKAPIADPLNLVAYPPSLNRVQEVEVTIEEVANAGGTEGFVFDFLTFDVQPLGKTRFPESAERI